MRRVWFEVCAPPPKHIVFVTDSLLMYFNVYVLMASPE